MALPTLVKTWQHSINQRVTAQGTNTATNKRVIRTIKNLLIGFGTLPWSVRGSSNSTAAGMDSVDRWTTDADIVGNTGGSVHSWIVLRQTGLATNFELCWDINSGTAGLPNTTVAVSWSAGFTGGSTTARPTATDETVLITTTTWGGIPSSSADADVVIHAQQSTDGQCTRLYTYYQNAMSGLWIFDRAQSPVTGWTNPNFAFAMGGSSTVATDTNLSSSFSSRGRGSASFNIAMTHEGINGSATGHLIQQLTAANSFDSSYPLFPIGLASLTASHVGRHGTVFDLWFGLTAAADKDTYPNDTSRQFVTFGDLVFPWSGAVPETA